MELLKKSSLSRISPKPQILWRDTLITAKKSTEPPSGQMYTTESQSGFTTQNLKESQQKKLQWANISTDSALFQFIRTLKMSSGLIKSQMLHALKHQEYLMIRAKQHLFTLLSDLSPLILHYLKELAISSWGFGVLGVWGSGSPRVSNVMYLETLCKFFG